MFGARGRDRIDARRHACCSFQITVSHCLPVAGTEVVDADRRDAVFRFRVWLRIVPPDVRVNRPRRRIPPGGKLPLGLGWQLLAGPLAVLDRQLVSNVRRQMCEPRIGRESTSRRDVDTGTTVDRAGSIWARGAPVLLRAHEVPEARARDRILIQIEAPGDRHVPLGPIAGSIRMGRRAHQHRASRNPAHRRRIPLGARGMLCIAVDPEPRYGWFASLYFLRWRALLRLTAPAAGRDGEHGNDESPVTGHRTTRTVRTPSVLRCASPSSDECTSSPHPCCSR